MARQSLTTADGTVIGTVTTDWHRREIVDGWQLPPDARASFDYLDWQAIGEGSDSASFVRYRGEWYDLGDSERVFPGSELARAGWHGFYGESFFSAVVFRYVHTDCHRPDCGDYDAVVIGHAIYS